VPLHCLRARLSSAPVVRIEARLGRTGEGMGRIREHLGPIRSSELAFPRVFDLSAQKLIIESLERVERARARDV
jgi:hypothetical protein